MKGNIAMSTEKKKVLIYAHYYFPDVASTGQLLQELAEGLTDIFDVTVICVVPSYSGKIDKIYKGKIYFFDNINGVHIVRVGVPEFSKGKKLERIRNILAYYKNAKKATRHLGDFDFIFTISQPPILGGMLGVYGKKKKKAKLIYNIQDFNPEQIEAVGYSKNGILLKILKALDKRTCQRSDLLITVGRDLVETIKRRFRGEETPKTVMIPNWVDEKQVYPLEEGNSGVFNFKQKYGLVDKFIFMYSGNIGLYYDLENLLEVMAKFSSRTRSFDGREVCFVFVGAGGVLEKLQMYVRSCEIKNVKFIPYQDKSSIIYSLNAADVHLCVNAKGIKGVSCPSKFYGIAAVAKPVLAVLEEGTEIRSIIEESQCGLVSSPGNYNAFYNNLSNFIHMSKQQRIQMGKQGYKYFCQYLRKDTAIQRYIEQFMSLGESNVQ